VRRAHRCPGGASIRSGQPHLITIVAVGKLKAKNIGKIKPKSKCCKKNTRCVKCPVVLHRLGKQDCRSMCKKDFQKVLDKARKR
jgi:hypothetical protein